MQNDEWRPPLARTKAKPVSRTTITGAIFGKRFDLPMDLLLGTEARHPAARHTWPKESRMKAANLEGNLRAADHTDDGRDPSPRTPVPRWWICFHAFHGNLHRGGSTGLSMP